METALVPIRKKDSNGSSSEKRKDSMGSSNKQNDTKGSSSEKHKGVKNHERAAHHHEKAAKHHREAAKHHKDGNNKKASESMVKALGHHYLASEAQNEDLKFHVIKK
jgi:hypothetical protein